MELKYRKRIKYFHLIMAIAFFAISMASVLDISHHWWVYGYFPLIFYYFANFFYMNRHPYLFIEKGLITKNELFNRKKIKIENIKKIIKIAGDYIIKTENKRFTIALEMMEKQSKERLEKFVENTILPKIDEKI